MQGITESWQNKEKTTPYPSAAPRTLEELYKQISDFESCALKKTALSTVICDGNPNSPLMMIGEAPGADEDRLGKPFVGVSGQLLMRMLEAIHLKREDVYITNILPWRPPFNRPPTPAEIEQCLPFVHKHIALAAPRILLLVGNVACKALLNSDKGISLLQTEELFYQSPLLPQPIACMAIYHPSYLLRSPSQKRTAWQQLLKLQKMLQILCPSSYKLDAALAPISL